MKSKLQVYSLGVVLFGCSFLAHSQIVTNSGFENWALSNTYQIPSIAPAPLFQSSNDEIFYNNNVLVATKVGGESGFGLKVENFL
jgi:hypothetical protein